MPEPLKNMYNQAFIQKLASHIKEVYASFPVEKFTEEIFTPEWEALELKERMKHIAITLFTNLDGSYAERIRTLYPVTEMDSNGFELIIFPTIVELFGLDEFDVSVEAMEHFTKSSSAEFAVRPFIIKYPQMMEQMTMWAESENHHVRRLASEGCRPRLPWAMTLPEFKKDPSPILPILQTLQDDPSDYVRKSVANNLNDISKDNPEITINIANQWHGQNNLKDKLIKHACRTLLKAGDSRILPLFGYEDPSHVKIKNTSIDKKVPWGENLNFSFDLQSSTSLGLIRLEYALYFLRKNGTFSRKVFKISESQISEKKKTFKSKYSFKAITTRSYYAGKHAFALIVNGVEQNKREFQLLGK